MIAIEITAVPDQPEPTQTETRKFQLSEGDVEQILAGRILGSITMAVNDMLGAVLRDAEQEHARRG